MTAQATTASADRAPRRRTGNPLLRRYARAFRSPRGVIGASIIAVLVLLSLLAPVLFPGGFDQQTRDALLAPSLQHFFGTDEVGRDIFVRTIYGARVDLSLVFVAVPIAAVLGTLLGLVGILGNAAGAAVQRGLDVIVGFPSLILGISVTLVLGAGWTALVVALAIYSTPAFGRLARATLLTQQNRDYVQAARMLGTSKASIMTAHILPHTLDTAVTQAVVAVVSSIFLESSLSIVGLGIQPPQPSLGALLNSGARYMQQLPSYVLGPAAVLLILVLGFSLLADALNRAGAGR